LRLEFTPECRTELNHDYLAISSGRDLAVVLHKLSGPSFVRELVVPATLWCCFSPHGDSSPLPLSA